MSKERELQTRGGAKHHPRYWGHESENITTDALGGTSGTKRHCPTDEASDSKGLAVINQSDSTKAKNHYEILLDEYVKWLTVLGFAETTIYDYPKFVRRFTSWVQKQGYRHIDTLTRPTVFDYFEFLSTTKGERTGHVYSTAHLNRNFEAIDKFLECLHAIGFEKAPSPTGYRIKRQREKEIVILTREEIQELYNAVGDTFQEYRTLATRQPRQQTVKLVLDLCYGCGLRKSEVLNLKIADVFFSSNGSSMNANGYLHIRQGKNYKDRYVPLNSTLYQSLQHYIFGERKSLAHKRAEYVYPFKATALADALDMLVIASGNLRIKRKAPSLHTLRHSIASHLLQAGMHIESVSRYLGHSSLESTEIYTHLMNEDE